MKKRMKNYVTKYGTKSNAHKPSRSHLWRTERVNEGRPNVATRKRITTRETKNGKMTTVCNLKRGQVSTHTCVARDLRESQRLTMKLCELVHKFAQ